MKLNKMAIRSLLIVAVGFIVFAGISSLMMWKSFSNNRQGSGRKILADAVILKVKRTGLVVKNRTELKLLLEVYPHNNEPFKIWVKETVYSPDVYLYVQGAKLKVVYNSESPQKIYLASAPVQK